MVAATDAPPADRPGLRLTDHRALTLVAAAGLLLPLQSASAAILQSPVDGLLGAAMTAAAMLLLCTLATTTSSEGLERLDWWLLGAGIVILIIAISGTVAGLSAYLTDEAALVHGAATALLHGHDPYGRDLSSALARYGVTGNLNLTYLMNGGAAHTLNYPALAVLAVVPNVAIGHNSAAVVFVAGTGACLAAAAMFLVLPKPLRPLAVIVCVDSPILIDFAAVGLTTQLMLVSLTVCAYRWGSVGSAGTDGRGSLERAGAIRAVCLGLALAVNQLAWFITPFLLAGTFLSARSRLGSGPALRVVLRYGLIAVLVFGVINAPFIAWGPGAWLSGVEAPVLQHAVPSGQGLVGLTVFARIGSGALSFYGYGAVLLYLALLTLLCLRFERLSRCMILFPLLVLYTSARSLDSYWLAPISIVIVSVVCSGTDGPLAGAPRQSRGHSRLRRPRRPPEPVLWAALLAPAIACFAVALGTPGPIKLRITGTHSNRRGDVNQLTVMASNTSSEAVTPHFALTAAHALSDFWRVVAGPARLRPGASSRYVLDAQEAKSEPPAGTKYILQAYTDAPETISSSARVTAPGT